MASQTAENFYQPANSQLVGMIDKLVNSDLDFNDQGDLFKRIASMKHKDILRETISEYSRRGNFVRVYPAKGTDIYD